MSYLVLARKYRPQSFDSVIGQEHVVRVLRNSITRERIAHAYLFTGPRGVGKTSLARIFAKALNCSHGPTDSPCLKCQNCLEISQGISLAVREIDGASNNSVDNARDLIESTRTLPPPGSLYKIYIIDEVHMLSTSAFNALLKIIEEPPPHTCFVFATTDPQKIPETILSRVQRHDLRSVQIRMIEKSLQDLVQQEKISITDDAVTLIARNADGSLRDAHSLLERTLSFSDNKITAADVSHVVGTVDTRLLLHLVDNIILQHTDAALTDIDEIFSRSVEETLFLREFVEVWRVLLAFKIGKEALAKRVGGNEAYLLDYDRLTNALSVKEFEVLSSHALEESDRAIRSFHPRFAIEAMVVRLCGRESVVDLNKVISLLENGALASHSPVGRQASSPHAAYRVNSLPSEIKPSPVINPPESFEPWLSSSVPSSFAKSPPLSALEDSSESLTPEFDWYKFMAYCEQKITPILLNYLKRLSPELVSSRQLVLRGSKFAISYLDSGQRSKLQAALLAFCPGPPWSIELKESTDDNQSGSVSVIEVEEEKRVQNEQERDKIIEENPTVQVLKRILPGSRIERNNLN